MTPDSDQYPFGDPSSEYMAYKGYDKIRDIELEDNVSTKDLLVAFLRAGDAIFHELRVIRKALEENGLIRHQAPDTSTN